VTILRNAAMRFAGHGYPVFPLRPRGKTPAIAAAHPEGDPQHGVCHGECGRLGHGLYDATADPEQVWRWWRRWPMANIGVPCGQASGWLAIDLDGATGEASWAQLVLRHGVAATLTTLTGRGRHHLWRYPPECGLGNTSGKVGPRIDSRGEGGYVVVPPSVHPSGQTYRWYPEDRPGPNGAQEPPVWLLDTLSAPPAPAPAPSTRRPGEYVDRAASFRLPRHLAQLVNQDPTRRGRGAYHLVVSAIEWGLSDSEVHTLAEAHQATADKYAGRLGAEVDRIIRKTRPNHDHVGHPCDTAGCRNAPDWLRRNMAEVRP
jgi:Bifunctional DNA primase/polymerase, N-terminal